MRAITKGPEPAKLQAYRAVPGATYDGKDFTPVKDEIRAALLNDQLAVCCYCMRRISVEARPLSKKPDAPPVVQMKVEHWQSQDAFPHLQLIWSNLLGACLGGMGSSPQDQTCDTRKGEGAIILHPLDPAHIATLHCSSSGRLSSTDPRLQEDIDERLGLNHRVLVADRKARLDRDRNRLIARHPLSIPESAVRRAIAEAETPVEGRLPEHAFVLRLWAQKRFGASKGISP
ncbi:MAG: hypothetical protein ABJE95_14745 [Byssovorax sp.]